MGTCYIAQGAQLGGPWWPRGVGWGCEGGPRERGYIYIHIYIYKHKADSLHCTAETYTTLYSNYTPIKNKNKTKLAKVFPSPPLPASLFPNLLADHPFALPILNFKSLPHFVICLPRTVLCWGSNYEGTIDTHILGKNAPWTFPNSFPLPPQFEKKIQKRKNIFMGDQPFLPMASFFSFIKVITGLWVEMSRET